MAVTIDPRVRDYLHRLHLATRDLPRSRQRELIDEIEAHIVEALPPDASEADVRNVLDRLGEPDAIGEAERERLGITAPRAGALEWFAIPLLLLGGFFPPVLGWIVGVVLLWASRVWPTRDKITATLLLPGGLLPAAMLLLFSVGPLTGTLEIAGTALLAVLIVAPIVTAVRLARRAVHTRRL